MGVQTIRCKTCNTMLAACIEKHINSDWIKTCSRYIKTENVIIETVNNPVKFDGELNDCCGRKLIKALNKEEQ